VPSALTLGYAIPLCMRRLIDSPSGQRQHGVHVTCFKPMRYDASSNAWLCECGNIDAGELVAARRWLADAA
jgi:hypothetical protein